MSREPYQFRNADGSLRLDELLGEDHVRHYTRILEASPREFAAMQLSAGVAADPRPDGTAYSWREPPPGIGVVDGFIMQARGRGPDECSSSVFLVLLPEIIWDVCGYYRRLGFHWTEFRHVTDKMIRLHYLALDPRQEREDLYYAAGQLLDPVIRRAYDLQPLGALFLGDRDVREVLERMAAMEASRINAEAHAAGVYEDEPITQGDVLSQWGFDKAGISAAEARERLRDAYAAESEPLDGAALGASLSGWDRNWSYYRLVSPDEPSRASREADAAVLERWQALLCAVLSDHGVTVRFSVGIWPGRGTKVWRDSNRSCIFFSESDEVTQRSALEAVRGYLALTGKQAGKTGGNAHADPYRG